MSTNSEFTTHIFIFNPNNTTSTQSASTIVQGFSTANNLPPGSQVIVVGSTQRVASNTAEVVSYFTQQAFQTPFTEEEEKSLGLVVNQDIINLPPQPIENYSDTASDSSTNSLSILESSVVTVALDQADPLVWIYEGQQELRYTLRHFGINYYLRKD